MAYRLKRRTRVGPRLRRIADAQLRRAIEELTAGGDAAIHAARRRVKKVRALLLLIDHPGLGPQARTRLREISRLLAPIADAEASMRTFERLCGRRATAPPPAAQEVVALLLRHAHDEAVRDAARAPARAARLLAETRLDLAYLRVPGRGFTAVEHGLWRGITRSRRAMRRALRRPTSERFHVWRRRAKTQWLQLRLVAGPAGEALTPLTRQLGALDSVLGEHHDISLIESTLRAAPQLPRTHAVACLRALRRRRAFLRRRAQRLGASVHALPPKAQVRACRRAWKVALPLPRPHV